MKVRARKCSEDGIQFDSMHERDVYLGLRIQQRAGLIRELRCHPKFIFVVNGITVGTMKPDFSYIDATDQPRIIDAKGFKKSKKTGKMLPRVDREFGLKRKLMRALFDLDVEIL